MLVDCLATAAVKINDEVSLLDILNGLSIKFSAFRISIITRDTNLSLAELEVLLDAEAKTIALLSRRLNQLRWRRPPSNTLVAAVVESSKEVAAVGCVGEEGMEEASSKTLTSQMDQHYGSSFSSFNRGPQQINGSSQQQPSLLGHYSRSNNYNHASKFLAKWENFLLNMQ